MLTAIRDDEVAARSSGARVGLARMLVFVVAGAGCGAAGAVLAISQLQVQPSAVFSVQWTAEMAFATIIGGLGTIEGPIIGTAVYMVLQQTLASYNAWYLIILGLVAMAVALFARRGLWGLVDARLNVRLFPVGYYVRLGEERPRNLPTLPRRSPDRTARPARRALTREDPGHADALTYRRGRAAARNPRRQVEMFGLRKTRMITADEALPGRSTAMRVPARHEVLGAPLAPPYPPGTEIAEFALGCFWGAERKFWQVPGVVTTAVGYEGGFTPNPTYEEVCSGRTGHSEAVRVVFDPAKVSYRDLLKVFWESHDPTQGMRQGNDVGTQYRSAIFYHSDEQRAAAEESLVAFQKKLSEAGYGEITTQIEAAPEFYFAEDYHQQYLSSERTPTATAAWAAPASPAQSA